MDCDTLGNIYAAVPGKQLDVTKAMNRLYKFTPEGSQASNWSAPDGLHDIEDLREYCSLSDGSLLVLTGSQLAKWDINGAPDKKADGSPWVASLPADSQVRRLNRDRAGNAVLSNATTGQITKYDGFTAIATSVTFKGTGVVADASNPRFWYAAYSQPDGKGKQVLAVEKYDLVLSRTLAKEVVTEGNDSIRILDLKVDRGGNVAVGFNLANTKNNATDYRNTLVVLDQSSQPTPQNSSVSAVFEALGRSVYDPNLSEPEFKVDLANMDVLSQKIQLGREGAVSIRTGGVLVSLGNFGAKLDGSLSGKAAIRASLTGNLGRFNVTYPIDFSIEAPPKNDPSMTAGRQFKVKVSYAQDTTSSLSTTPPQLNALVSGQVALASKSKVTGVAYSKSVIDRSLPDINLDSTFTLFDTSKFTTNPYTFDLPSLSGSGGTPQIRTQGGFKVLQGGKLSSSGSEVFFSCKAELADLIPGNPQTSLSVDFPGDPKNYGTIKAKYARASADFVATLRQSFSFDPGRPVISFVDDKGAVVKFAESSSGEITLNAAVTELTFTMPASGGLVLYPIVKLPFAEFSSQTSLESTSDSSFEPFSGRSGLNADKYQMWNDSWNLFKVDPAKATKTDILASRKFRVDNLGITKGTEMLILGNNTSRPFIEAVSRPSLTMYILNQELVGQPANYSRARRELERYITGTTSIVLYGENFGQKTTRFFFQHLGQKYELKSVDNSGVAGGLKWYSPNTVVLEVPNFFTVLPGQAVITAEDSVTGNSNSVPIPIEYPQPNVSTVGPNLWASDPLSGQVYITVTDARDSRGSDTFLARRDYFFWLDEVWGDIFSSLGAPASQVDLLTFFPASGIRIGNQYDIPTLPLIRWKVGQTSYPLSTYGEPVPSGLLWAILPDDYFSVATPVSVSLEVGGLGGGVSPELVATVAAPQPIISSLDPPRVIPGSEAFTLTVNGPSNVDPPGDNSRRGNFNPQSVINIDGKPVATKFVSSSELSTEISATMIATRRIALVSVTTPGNGTTYFDGSKFLPSGGTSRTIEFPISSPQPEVASIAPATVPVGFFDAGRVTSDNPTPNFVVAGAGFTTRSKIFINGAAVPTTYKSAELLTAILGPEYSAAAKSYNVQVRTTESDNSVLSSATLNLVVFSPATISAISCEPTVLGGQSLTLLATASGLAGPDGIRGVISSDNQSIVPNPGSIQVQAQQGTAETKIATRKVTKDTVVTLTLTQEFGKTLTQKITVVSAGIGTLTFKETQFEGGTSTTGTVTIGSPAPTGGARIKLESTNPNITVPATVTIPSGSTTVGFTCGSLPVTSQTTGSVKATYLGTSVSASVTLDPLTLEDAVFDRQQVKRGESVVLTVTLSQPAPSDINVPLQCDAASGVISNFPVSVRVLKGQKTGSVTLKTLSTFKGPFPFFLIMTCNYQNNPFVLGLGITE